MFTQRRSWLALAAFAFSCVATVRTLAQALPGFELLGTEEVTEIRGSTIIPGGAAGWRVADPAKARGLVVTLKATFPADVRELDISALQLTWSGASGEKSAACLGATLQGPWKEGGQWFITDPEKGTSLNLSSQGDALEASYLFGIPPTVKMVSVVYKTQKVVKGVALNWK